MLRTSANMRPDILHTLNAAAERLGKPRREVIVKLLMRIMDNIGRFQGGFTLVRYQERNPEKQWRCVGISFKKDEYEFFSDIRRLSKFSVSFLITIATERYLDDLLNEAEEEHNNTAYTHYTIGQRVENGILCWEMYWGDPTPTLKGGGNTKIHRRTASL
ncbi:MAG: hypothetical protein EPN93_09580 [Spirochaetes bacterium]|nr:MAG: hypothetical protein EPN93_09580 [Spirochaetota bacterium]